MSKLIPNPFRAVCQHADRPFHLNRPNHNQNFLGKGNQQAPEQAEKTLCTLTGVVGLDAHAHLNNAPAQDDNTQSLDDGENEVREVVDDGERVRTGGKGRSCTGKRNGSDKAAIQYRCFTFC